jgi:hypothetical protein
LSRTSFFQRALALASLLLVAACSGSNEADAIVGGPRKLAGGQITVRGMLSNQDSVFWARETTQGTGDILTARADGTTAPIAIGSYRVTTASSRAAAPFVVDDEYIFWIRDGFLLRHSHSSTGTSAVPSTQVIGPCAGRALALDATYVYWTEWEVASSSLSVVRQPIAGGIPTTLAFAKSFSSGGLGPSGVLAVNDEFVYLGLSGFTFEHGSLARAARVPKLGGTLEPLPIDPAVLATDEDAIYWSEDTISNPRIFSVDRRVPVADMLKAARLLGPGRTLSVGRTVVYGTEDRTLWQARKSGGLRTEPLAGPPVDFVSVHGSSIYLGVDDGVLAAGGAKLTAITVLPLE